MNNIRLRNHLAVLAVAGVLAACGSSSDDNSGPPASPSSQVPQSAQASVSGLIAFMNELINTMTNETSEPIVLGDAVLPTSDSDGPGALTP